MSFIEVGKTGDIDPFLFVCLLSFRHVLLMIMADMVAQQVAGEVVGAVAPDCVDVVAVVLNVGDFY